MYNIEKKAGHTTAKNNSRDMRFGFHWYHDSDEKICKQTTYLHYCTAALLLYKQS